MKTKNIIETTDKYSARNYNPLGVVLSVGEGVWVYDVDGKRYLDMLSAYSALNQGHRHPRIVEALINQVNRLTLTSRAFYTDIFAEFAEKLCTITKMDLVLPMNSGAEAVETAIKVARKWGNKKKGIKDGKAKIIVCKDNFHGRTTTIISFSTEEQYRDGFGPLTPGFETIPYNDTTSLENIIDENTAAFLVEPIQGEAGVVVPDNGYLKKVREITKKHNVLLIADEIQTGLGRTGKLFCFEHDNIRPDMIILGKALGGGMLPVSAVVAPSDVLGVLNPGDHGSTFGGNPLACAVAIAALDVIVDEKLANRAEENGNYLMAQLKKLALDNVKEIRGKGLLIGMELKEGKKTARQYCEALKDEGVLCKETHDRIIRFAPPLVIDKEAIDFCVEKVSKVLSV